MSFEMNYGNHYPFDEDYDEETVFTKEELLQLQIEKHLEDEENELEEIKERYRSLKNAEKQTSKIRKTTR